MIYGYKLSEIQKDLLINQKYDENSYFNPIQDINDEWFIFEEEYQGGLKIFNFFNSLEKTQFIQKEYTGV